MAFLKIEDINYMEESVLDNTYSNSITTESYFNTTLVTISKLNIVPTFAIKYSKASAGFIASL